MAIIIIIINIIVFSWLPVFEKHLQKANNDGVIHIGNGNSVGSSTKKTKTKNKQTRFYENEQIKQQLPQQQ